MDGFELPDSMDKTNSVTHLIQLYTKLVRNDPVTFRALETLFRSVSYMSTSRFSNEISEMFFTSASLLQYVNDGILTAKRPPCESEEQEYLECDKHKLEQMLHVLQCVEVFIELWSRRIGGNALRWVFVFIIAAVKTSIRMCLLYKHNKVLEGCIGSNKSDVPQVWVGARTGLFFKQSHPKSYMSPHIPNRDMILAELCYALRPMIHLTALVCFRSKSWIPYLLSLGLDLFSLKTINKLPHPTERQALELSKRKQSLILYLFRSPCYNVISERYVTSLLQYVDKVPVLNIFTDGLVEYIPEWQKMYYYVWGG